MSWIDRIVEQQIASAIERGELDTPERLRGKPLDLDTQRGDGWWAEQFVRKERSHLLREESLPQRAALQAKFWHAATLPELTALVTEANRWVAGVNQRLLSADELPLFDPHEAIETWKAVRRPAS
ncbi:MAG: DnaJ family domain-containing protein [Ilumatobacteraceae bacterium]